MDNQKEEYWEIDVLRLVNALWRQAWIVILAMLLCGTAAFCFARYLVTPLYESSALMYVNNSSISVGSTSVSLQDLTASKSLVDTYIVIMKTRLTLNEVIRRAGLTYTYEELYDMIRAGAVNSTEIFQITVTGEDPAEATLIANTIVEVLPDKISDIMEGSSVRIVDFAVIPSRKASPSITKYTALGLMIGFLLSAGAIILIELFDDQIHDEELLLRSYGLSVLAVIPDLLDDGHGKGYYYRSYYSSYYRAPARESRYEQAAE